MPRFISPYAGLRLFGGPLGTVRFLDGAYQTDDPEEARWLRSHRGFGVDFFEEGAEADRPAPPPDPKALETELERAKAQIRELLGRLAVYEAQQPEPYTAVGESAPEGFLVDSSNDSSEPRRSRRRGGQGR